MFHTVHQKQIWPSLSGVVFCWISWLEEQISSFFNDIKAFWSFKVNFTPIYGPIHGLKKPNSKTNTAQITLFLGQHIISWSYSRLSLAHSIQALCSHIHTIHAQQCNLILR